MKTVKKILAILALIGAAGAIVTTLAALLSGNSEIYRWMYVCACLFLGFGSLALIIDYFMKKQAERKTAENAEAEQEKQK